MSKGYIKTYVDFIKCKLGIKNSLVIKKITIGKKNYYEAVVVYIDSLVDSTKIEEHILKNLMLYVDESVIPKNNPMDFICSKYITTGNASVIEDIEQAAEAINSGATVVIFDNFRNLILVNTPGGEYRPITEPENETTVKGSREGFIENIDTNIGMIKRNIHDKNLMIEMFTVGIRSQNTLAIAYIDDIVDKDILAEIKGRLENINVDSVADIGMVEQYIESSPYSIFPQLLSTERPDRIKAYLMEGSIAILLSGTPYTLVCPAILPEFFQAVEDYSQRTIVSSFVRLLRVFAILIVILLPSVYLTLISYNVELIPINFILPIAQSRQGIPFPPFFEIMLMEIIVELLREGGLRLPPKIAQTLSIVGGIIIGNAAIQSKIVSPTTLLVIGISSVASFLIPNYEMSLSIRFIRFPMLVLADAIGFLGIISGVFFLMIHLFSLKTFGVPYLEFRGSEIKDIFIRSPLWKMNKRPESLPNTNPIQQRNFRWKFGRKRNE